MKYVSNWLTTLFLCTFLIYSFQSFADDKRLNFDELVARYGRSPEKDLFDLECDACKAVVYAVQFLARLNTSEDDIISVCTDLCISLKVQDRLVCSGIVPEFKNEVLYVFTSIALGPDEVCGVIVGDGCGTQYNPWKQNWTVTLPDKPKPTPTSDVPKPGVPLLRILHLSDIHIDLQYTEGLNAECGEPLCCRPPNAHAPPGRPAGKWGDYECDSPLWTISNLFQHLTDAKDQFDLIYWTGDLPAHNVWNQTRAEQLYALHVIVEQMKYYFGDKIVFPTLGNHESAPVNSFPPPYITGVNSNQWLLDSYQHDFSYWLPDYTSDTIRKGGFYSAIVVPGLKVISLNTNYCNNDNWWMLLNETDPAGQLQWLVNELQKSEDVGEKVHVIGHIGPGLGSCLQTWSWNYYHTVNRYESTIVGQFFGHTHNDEFELFYDENDATRAVGVAFLGPSVTPYKGNNPGYRIYELDGVRANSTFHLVDHHVYYLNLSEANANGNVTWQLEYSAKKDYELENLLPPEWSRLVDRMEEDISVFDKFFSYYHRRSTFECRGSCRNSTLCGLRSGRSHDSTHCANTTEAHRYYFNHKSC